MAQENREEYGTTPAVINETVRAARDFLREHPEERAEFTPAAELQDDRQRERSLQQDPGEVPISLFLGWPRKRVGRALADIHATEPEDSPIDEEALSSMPTQEHSASFRKSIQESHQKTVRKLLASR